MTTVTPNAAYWAAYDRLPAPVRAVLQAAAHPYDAVSIEFQWRKFEAAGISPEGYAARLKRVDSFVRDAEAAGAGVTVTFEGGR
jgi:hypothetical protein